MLGKLAASSQKRSTTCDTLSALRSGLEASVLVTDYLMPRMSGAALVKEMRGAGLQLPSLIITAYANAGLDVPADVPKLAKPFRQADLAARLDELLERELPSRARKRLRVVE